jgi:hypothetical protein
MLVPFSRTGHIQILLGFLCHLHTRRVVEVPGEIFHDALVYGLLLFVYSLLLSHFLLDIVDICLEKLETVVAFGVDCRAAE